MSHLRSIFALSLFLATVFVCNHFALAQEQSLAPQVEGYAGQVTLLSNLQRKETTVVLTLGYATEGRSSQLVFHLQHSISSIPSSWNGMARVLVADDIVAIIPAASDPKDRPRGFLFKFSERAQPTSLEGMDFDAYTVFGIGRFGEHKPLALDEIESLVKTGRVYRDKPKFELDGANSLSSDLAAGLANPLNTNPNPGQCVAGGPGSSSCGAGGCTVTCGKGYYSCCQGGTCLCNPDAPK